MNIKVNASISDFPIFIPLETFFKEYKKAGVDGVEIVGGYKSRWSMKTILSYAKKYQLPVMSIHQPLWSGINVYFDEKFFANLARREIKKITFHPLTLLPFSSPTMQKYFNRLASLQEKYDITVCLENMPDDRYYHKLYNYPNNKFLSHLEDMYNIAQAYGFSLTYDVSHAELAAPQKEKAFNKIFSTIANIHLSSFNNVKHHLPVYAGNLDTDGFIEFLLKKQYKGLITLELNRSFFLSIIAPYNFSGMAKSVAYIKEKARTL